MCFDQCFILSLLKEPDQRFYIVGPGSKGGMINPRPGKYFLHHLLVAFPFHGIAIPDAATGGINPSFPSAFSLQHPDQSHRRQNRLPAVIDMQCSHIMFVVGYLQGPCITLIPEIRDYEGGATLLNGIGQETKAF